MKTVDTQELAAIQDVAFELERRIELYGDKMEEECLADTDTLNVLKGIVNKPDFAPTVKYVEVEVPVEKLLNSDEVQDKIKLAEKHGRELVNPNYKYCVFCTGHPDVLYLTDDVGAAMDKAKSLSKIQKEIYTVYAIRQAYDKTYKTYADTVWAEGELLKEPNEEFLHYDFLSQMAHEIKKL